MPVCLVSPGVATAQVEFEDLFQQGNQLAQAGRSAQALSAYKRAYQARPEPIVLVAMGLVNLQLGHYQEALRACQKYLLVETSAAPQQKQATACVARAKEGLRSAISEKATQPIPSTQSPVSAEPPASPLPPKPVEITEPVARESTVPLHGKDWSPDPVVLDVPEASSPSNPVLPPVSAPAAPVYKKWWLWTAIGLAAAGTAVGLGVGLTQNSSPPPSPSPTPDPYPDIAIQNRIKISF